MSADRNDGLSSFVPEETLDMGGSTARDPVPHRGLVADLDCTDELFLEPGGDTTSEAVPVLDRTMPIGAAALEALLTVERSSDTDISEAKGVLLEASEDFDDDATMLDMGNAADVAAGLLGHAAFDADALPPTPARPVPPPLDTPPPDFREIPIDAVRPTPLAPVVPPGIRIVEGQPASTAARGLTAPAGIATSYARPIAAPELEDDVRVRPAFLLGLAALPFLVFLAWWLG